MLENLGGCDTPLNFCVISMNVLYLGIFRKGENGMQTKVTVDLMMETVKQYGLVSAIERVFGKSIAVTLPISQRLCNLSIDELDFSPRAINSLKRAGVFLVDDVIGLITGRGLMSVRNLGKRTENEIKTRLLVYAYEDLSDMERRGFFERLLASLQ